MCLFFGEYGITKYGCRGGVGMPYGAFSLPFLFNGKSFVPAREAERLPYEVIDYVIML